MLRFWDSGYIYSEANAFLCHRFFLHCWNSDPTLIPHVSKKPKIPPLNHGQEEDRYSSTRLKLWFPCSCDLFAKGNLPLKRWPEVAAGIELPWSSMVCRFLLQCFLRSNWTMSSLCLFMKTCVFQQVGDGIADQTPCGQCEIRGLKSCWPFKLAAASVGSFRWTNIFGPRPIYYKWLERVITCHIGKH